MTTSLMRATTSTTLLAHLIETPDLVQTVHELPPPAFSALVRHVGLEDAGELVALATREQLVAAFDEDLFANARPGEREELDSARFVTWLTVLMEAGDDVAANRIAELSEEFVVQALSSIVLVLDHDALMERMAEGGRDAAAADKAIESRLSEEIDGYLLISRYDEGWDVALALVLALDRDHRELLVRILDRCSDVASSYVDDLGELASVLSEAESIAEDVEAEREERRSKQGYVEPRAAKSFLTLARGAFEGDARSVARDPVTKAYFRDLDPAAESPSVATSPRTARVLRALSEIAPTPRPLLLGEDFPLVAAVRALGHDDPRLLAERMEELGYLANVLIAGAKNGDGRFTPREAAEAVLATVGLGAELEGDVGRPVRTCHLDVLFRRASGALVRHGIAADGLVRSRGDVKSLAERIRRGSPTSGARASS